MSTEYLSVEINEAARLARRVEFQISDEFHPFNWESRLELAAIMREIAADSEGRVAQVAGEIQFRLESEASDFTVWEERLETANLAHTVAVSLERRGVR